MSVDQNGYFILDGTWMHKASISNINGPDGLSFHSTDNRGIFFTQKGVVNSFTVHTVCCLYSSFI